MSLPSEAGSRFAAAAAEFIGTPFRLHGRDPAKGLDCIGLIHASLIRIGQVSVPPEGYRLRNLDPTRWFDFATYSGLLRVQCDVVTGDVILIEPAPGQQHLVIAESDALTIHAHAGLRRVVRQPMALPREPLAHWRLI